MESRLLGPIAVLGVLGLSAARASTVEPTSLAEPGELRQALVSAGLGANDDR